MAHTTVGSVHPARKCPPRKKPRGGYQNSPHRDALVTSPALSAGGGLSPHGPHNCRFCASRPQTPPPQETAGRLPKLSPSQRFGSPAGAFCRRGLFIHYGHNCRFCASRPQMPPRKKPRGGYQNSPHRDALVTPPALSAGGGLSPHGPHNCRFCASRSQNCWLRIRTGRKNANGAEYKSQKEPGTESERVITMGQPPVFGEK